MTLAEISRQDRLTTESQYVYVVDTPGLNASQRRTFSDFYRSQHLPLLDHDLQKAFAQALAQPDSETIHSQEYRWMNWHDRKAERKYVFCQHLSDKTFAAGYYFKRLNCYSTMP